jgi:hypothetical protein
MSFSSPDIPALTGNPEPAPDASPLQPQTPRTGTSVLTALLALALLALLLWQVPAQEPRAWLEQRHQDIVIDGQYYRLSEAQVQSLTDYTRTHFANSQLEGSQLLERSLSRQLDRLFVGLKTQLPEFADWYYSQSAEYMRLALYLSGGADGVDNHVSRQMQSRVFDAAGWQQGLLETDAYLQAMLSAHKAKSQQRWVDGLKARLREARPIPAPLTAEPGTDSAVRIDALLTETWQREQQSLQFRVAASSAASAGVIGLRIWRGMATRSAAVGGRAVAGRAAGRGAARAGSAAAGGATVCSPGGPLAIGCALVAGAAVWLATDWALLQYDEWRHREAFMAEIEQGLDGLRAELEGELLAGYAEQVALRQQAMDEQVVGVFVPWEAARR